MMLHRNNDVSSTRQRRIVVRLSIGWLFSQIITHSTVFVSGQTFPQCFLCNNDPDAVFMSPDTVIDLNDLLGVGEVSCVNIYDAGVGGFLNEEQCTALLTTPQALDPCQCSNLSGGEDSPAPTSSGTTGVGVDTTAPTPIGTTGGGVGTSTPTGIIIGTIGPTPPPNIDGDVTPRPTPFTPEPTLTPQPTFTAFPTFFSTGKGKKKMKMKSKKGDMKKKGKKKDKGMGKKLKKKKKKKSPKGTIDPTESSVPSFSLAPFVDRKITKEPMNKKGTKAPKGMDKKGTKEPKGMDMKMMKKTSAPTKAPIKAPTKIPTKMPTKAPVPVVKRTVPSPKTIILTSPPIVMKMTPSAVVTTPVMAPSSSLTTTTSGGGKGNLSTHIEQVRMTVPTPVPVAAVVTVPPTRKTFLSILFSVRAEQRGITPPVPPPQGGFNSANQQQQQQQKLNTNTKTNYFSPLKQALHALRFQRNP